MPNQLPLNVFAQVVLDGSGNGTAKIGPTRTREIWYPSVISPKVATNVKEAVCNTFIGPTATQPNFIDQTFTGSSGDSTDSGQGSQLNVGDLVICQWVGGDAGALATFTVTGQYQIGL